MRASSVTSHTTPQDELPNKAWGKGGAHKKNRRPEVKFTESPKVIFSGSGKEPSVLTPSLGFLPELSDAKVKSNTIFRPPPCFVTV